MVVNGDHLGTPSVSTADPLLLILGARIITKQTYRYYPRIRKRYLRLITVNPPIINVVETLLFAFIFILADLFN